MATTTGRGPGPQTTRALLEGIACGDHGARLRSQVASWNPGATREQVEEAFQEACVRAERLCTGQTEGEVFVWLRTTAHREVRAMRRRAQREVLVDVSSRAFEPVDRSATAAIDELIDGEDQAEVERLARAVLDRLSERQRAIAALHSRGVRRPQIAEHLGVTPRVVKRSLEQIMAAGREELVRLAGHGCDAGEQLVARFVFGLASAGEARRAQLHLATCARCGAMYARLDLWREQVAALLPLPAAAQCHAHVVERVVNASTDALSGSASHGGAGGLRRHVTEAFAHAREHAAAAYYRTVDPTPLAGVRPGAVAAAVVGCLAVGGGATYCAQQGVEPIAELTGTSAPAHHDKKPKTHRKRAHVAEAPAPPVVTSTATTPPPAVQQQPAPQQAPTTPTTTTQATAPPAPQDEYEPGSTGGTSQPAAQSASPQVNESAAPPAGGAGEFGGP